MSPGSEFAVGAVAVSATIVAFALPFKYKSLNLTASVPKSQRLCWLALGLTCPLIVPSKFTAANILSISIVESSAKTLPTKSPVLFTSIVTAPFCISANAVSYTHLTLPTILLV